MYLNIILKGSDLSVSIKFRLFNFILGTAYITKEDGSKLQFEVGEHPIFTVSSIPLHDNKIQ